MQFNILAAKKGLTRTLLVLKVLQDWMADQIRIDRSIEKDVLDVVAETKTIPINTRQYARLKKLQALVPGCTVNNAKDRILTYPVNREAEVLGWLANCPKGSKKEAKKPRAPKVYKEMDPKAKPGLKAAKRKKGEEEEGGTKHTRIIAAAEKILSEEALPFEQLYLRLRVRDRIPGGFNPRPILRGILNGCELFELGDLDTYFIRDRYQEDAPEVEATLIPETRMEVPDSEESNLRVPPFFPRWGKL